MPDAAPRLRGLRETLAAVESWDEATLERAVGEWIEASGLAMKDVAQPARVALTGRGQSPPLFEVMVVLGRGRSLERLRRAPSLVPA